MAIGPDFVLDVDGALSTECILSENDRDCFTSKRWSLDPLRRVHRFKFSTWKKYAEDNCDHMFIEHLQLLGVIESNL
jgi:hypothetical protein